MNFIQQLYTRQAKFHYAISLSPLIDCKFLIDKRTSVNIHCIVFSCSGLRRQNHIDEEFTINVVVTMANRKTDDSQNDDVIWIPRCEQVEEAQNITIEIENSGNTSNTEETNTFFQTLFTSIRTSITINLAAVPVALLTISILYLDLNTSNTCFEQNSRPRNVLKWVWIGDVVESIVINFWFLLSLILIFSWREFMKRHRGTVLIAILQGCLVSVCKTVLFIQHVDFTLDRYRYPGNVIFMFGVIYVGYVVSRNICAFRATDGLKKLRVFGIITAQYFLGCIIAFTYRYLTIPWFTSEENEIVKAIIAVALHLQVITINIINEKVALSSSQFVKPGRNFVFISFITGVSIIIFRTMQADVKNINIFIALSAYRGFVQILLTGSQTLRKRLSSAIRRFFRRRCCCCRQRFGAQNSEDGYNVRLDVDTYIQLMLYQQSALIVSQAYEPLYLICNFYTKLWDVLPQRLIRTVIGSAINLISNSISIFIYVYWHKSSLPKIWSRAWRLHTGTVTIGSVMTILYFTVVLLTVFQGSGKNLVLRNCTVPF